MSRYIDADALLYHLADYQLQEFPCWGANGLGNEDAHEAITNCIKAIEEQPTADVRENKQGEWIEYRDSHDAEPIIQWMCNKCEKIERKRSDFCPNCGTTMMKGENADVS